MSDQLTPSPAPWTVFDDTTVRSPDNQRIAIVNGFLTGSPLKQGEVNANLIAASPELLQQLKDARTLIRLYHGDAGWFIYDKYSPEMRRINAAIAKAEGRGDEVIDWFLQDHWGDQPPIIPNDGQGIEFIRKSTQFVEKIVGDAAKIHIVLNREAVAKRASFAISKGVLWWAKD